MHIKAGETIVFPYGARIVKRGRGWYRLIPNNTNRAIDKLNFALKVIRMFMKEQEEAVEAEIKKLIPVVLNIDLRVASFSNAHSSGEFGYLSDRQPPQQPKPAPAQSLQKLVAKFAARHL
jgi:hypothetical protein